MISTRHGEAPPCLFGWAAALLCELRVEKVPQTRGGGGGWGSETFRGAGVPKNRTFHPLLGSAILYICIAFFLA